MHLYYFKGPVPNFGDELNPWLIPALMPELLTDADETTIILPIGSILHDYFPAKSRKIVLGSGYGGYNKVPIIDDTWKFYFVRGPRTAEVLGIDKSFAVTDAAILLRILPELLISAEKRYDVSFMPHWESALHGAWEITCELAGVHLIDPRAPVETVLDEMRASKVIVTEAMHGAIVADALRVPWIPILPTGSVHRFKWLDWCDSLSLDYVPTYIGASAATEWVRSHTIGKNRTVRRVARQAGRVVNPLLSGRAADRLRKIATAAPSLSKDSICTERTQQAIERFEAFRSDYRAGTY